MNTPLIRDQRLVRLKAIRNRTEAVNEAVDAHMKISRTTDYPAAFLHVQRTRPDLFKDMHVPAHSIAAANFDPYHDALGRFTTKEGAVAPRGAHPKDAKPPPGASGSAIHNALSSLPIDTTYQDNGQANPGGIYLTHYGPGKKHGGWDPYEDTNTNNGIGNRGNKLTALSLAISDDLKEAAGLQYGDPVYVNGQYIGNYDDRAPENGRVDVYDLHNVAGTYWGGLLRGGRLSNKP